jgi:hypothetical protein
VDAPPYGARTSSNAVAVVRAIAHPEPPRLIWLRAGRWSANWISATGAQAADRRPDRRPEIIDSASGASITRSSRTLAHKPSVEKTPFLPTPRRARDDGLVAHLSRASRMASEQRAAASPDLRRLDPRSSRRRAHRRRAGSGSDCDSPYSRRRRPRRDLGHQARRISSVSTRRRELLAGRQRASCSRPDRGLPSATGLLVVEEWRSVGSPWPRGGPSREPGTRRGPPRARQYVGPVDDPWSRQPDAPVGDVRDGTSIAAGRCGVAVADHKTNGSLWIAAKLSPWWTSPGSTSPHHAGHRHLACLADLAANAMPTA